MKQLLTSIKLLNKKNIIKICILIIFFLLVFIFIFRESEVEYYRSKYAEWRTPAGELFNISQNEDIGRILNFIDKSGILAKALRNSNGLAKYLEAKVGHFGIVVLTDKDIDTNLWNRVSDNFISSMYIENEMIILKYAVKDPMLRGLILIHEGAHAFNDFYIRKNDENFTDEIDEYMAYQIEIDAINEANISFYKTAFDSSINGTKFLKEKGKLPAYDREYFNAMVSGLFDRLSEFDRETYASLLWIDSAFLVYDNLYINEPDKIIQNKINFLKENDIIFAY